MLVTTIVGTAQNGTISGVNLAAHVRNLEGRAIRVIIEEIPQETTNEDLHSLESS